MSPESVAMLGLGKMGMPMAKRLADQGFVVEGFDTDSSRRDALPGGITWYDISEFPNRSPILITMLPTSAAFRSALLDRRGVAANLPEKAIVIDMGSSDATETVRLGAELRQRSITLIDAPVSGGVAGAAEGRLTIMVGGDDEESIARVHPVLSALGTPHRVGPLGSGHALKSLNNFLAATIIAATGEALEIGKRFDIDEHLLLSVINASTGRSFASQTLFPEHVLSRKFGLGFSIGHMAKDVGLADKLARHLDMDAPFAALASRAWATARDGLEPDADFTCYQLHLERFRQPGRERNHSLP